MNDIYSMHNLTFRLIVDDDLVDEDTMFKLLFPLIKKIDGGSAMYNLVVDKLSSKPSNLYASAEVTTEIENFIKYTKDSKWRLGYYSRSLNKYKKILKFTERNAYLVVDDKNKSLNLYVDELQSVEGFSVVQELITEIIKLLYIKHMETEGYILVHAACVEYNHQGFLIIGDSGAGKTTILLHLLDEESSFCIANDSVFIKNKGGRIYAVSLPYFFNIRLNSLNLYKKLVIHQKIDNANHYINSYNDKVTFFHKDLVLNNKSGVYVDQIIFPIWNNSNMSYITELNWDECFKIIKSNIKSPTNCFINGLNIKHSKNFNLTSSEIYLLINTLLENTLNHRLSFGKDIYSFIKNEYKNYLSINQEYVEVIVDRPIGFVNEFGNVYNINYGYIPNIIGGDGEEQDAYIIDSQINKPINRYTGKLIAIVYRKDDVETKWIISNEKYNEIEIYDKIKFIENFFDSKVILCN